MNNANKVAVIVSFLSLGSAVYAAPAQVVDLSTQQPRATVNEGYENQSANGAQTYGTNASVSTSRENTTNGNESVGGETGSGSLFLQVQQLRDEVANLRGQMEEQSHTIENLSRQQMDMEQRLSGGASSGASSNGGSASAAASAAVMNNDGKDEYDAAYNLLKEKEYDKASAAFQGIVSKYPNSNYAGNSWFWLGFVYQTKGDMDGSAKAFSSLIEKFPTHSKVDDAKYNLGKIYNQQGKTEQARSLLKEVASGNSKSAPLAKSYLESM